MAIGSKLHRGYLFRLSIVVAVAIVLFGLSTLRTAETQAKKPYDKERLLKVVRLNALSTQEVIQAIEQRGVDFQTTPAVESEFRSAGARPELIESMRANYRAASPPPSASKPPSATGTAKPSANVPPGPPLSKNEIITLLQSGATPARVEQFVEGRGVNFALTPEIAREITAAGGNRSLLGAITEKAAPGRTSTPSRPSSFPANTGPDYDDLTDQAVSAMQANDANGAIRLLQQAVRMDPSKPTAYQYLGFAELYGRQDIISAERSMRAAIERGGSAVFYVFHDHDGFFRTYCEGSFFVTKAGMTYKAKDGNHTFAAEDSKIKETELNDFVGSEFGAFHIKVLQEGEKKKSKNYNFAPLTRKKTESNLIMSLIKSY